MKEDWQPFRLSEICENITDGKHGDCTPEPNSGFYFLSAKDVADGHLLYDNARQITETDFAEAQRRTRLEPNDILFTNSGTIGRMAIAKHHERTCQTTFQKSVAILKPRGSRVNPRFLYDLLRYDNSRLSDLAAGTAQKNLLLVHLRNFVVRIPNLTIQRKITAVLSAYDDLIENNTRRIQILEEMAQTLYREWFVHYRFPGHEQSNMVESEMGGIPEGWAAKELSLCVSIHKGKQPPLISQEELTGFVPYLLIDSIKNGASQFVDPKKLIIAREQDTLMVMDGASSGLVTIGAAGVVGSTLAAIKTVDASVISPYLLFHFLVDNRQKILMNNTGSAIPHANKDFINNLLFHVPTRLVNADFDSIAGQVHNLTAKLKAKNRNLSQTRDLLLPKLISGEVDVADLDIASGEQT